MNRRSLILGASALALTAAGGSAHAAPEVVIGCLFPLTGTAAPTGLDARTALEFAADLVNTRHTPLPMVMGAGAGLPRLGGATLRLVFADTQGDPRTAAAQAERLITQEHAVALIGNDPAIAELAQRHRRPCVTAAGTTRPPPGSAPTYVFRTGPDDLMFSTAMFACFHDLAARTGRAVRSVALFHEDSRFGADSAATQRRLAAAAGIDIRADISYRASSGAFATEAQQLKVVNADALLPTSHTADAIHILRAMHQIGYAPRAIMAQAAGFQTPSFLTASGKLAEGVMSRSSFALDAVEARPAIPPLNARFRARSGKDLNDDTSREVTALLVLADALNRAGTTRAEPLRAALATTDIDGARTIMPWRRIRFDAAGQNTGCTPVIQQVRRGAYRTIWPFDIATVRPVWRVGA